MPKLSKHLAVAGLAAIVAAAALPAGASAAMTMHHGRHHGRMLTVRPHYIPAHLRPGYVGAPGFAGGPPGPVVPTLIDFPQTGFFSPNGFVAYGTGVGNDLIGGIPGLVTGGIGLGTGLATNVIGAGTGVIGAGVGYLPR